MRNSLKWTAFTGGQYKYFPESVQGSLSLGRNQFLCLLFDALLKNWPETHDWQIEVRKIGNTATSLILQGFHCPFSPATQGQQVATCCWFSSSTASEAV
jgi:hypothetical protein